MQKLVHNTIASSSLCRRFPLFVLSEEYRTIRVRVVRRCQDEGIIFYMFALLHQRKTKHPNDMRAWKFPMI